jgi:hypothetical protein
MKMLKLIPFLILLFGITSCGKQEFAATKAPQLSSINALNQTSAQLCAQSTLIKPQVDILILWDNTSSFNFVTQATKDSMNKMITNVSENFDYHALSAPLVSTSGLLNEAVLIASNPSSVSGSATGLLRTKEQAIAALGFSRGVGSAEMGAQRAIDLIEGNRSNGIFRNGAYTLIVLMSNEDDKGCEYTTGYNSCTRTDLNNYLQPKKDKLLCLRGNAAGVSCAGTSPLNSSMMRFITIAPLTSCASGSYKVNSGYRDISKLLYETPYTNGWPTSNDHLNPDLAGYPDSYNLCTIDFSYIFDGVNSAIKQTLLKHVYDYWPVASASTSIDPDSILVTRDDGTVLTNNSNVPSPSNGFKYTDIVQTQNTRFLPTPGEPFTGKLIQLFGSNGNDKVIYPQCLKVTYAPVKSMFGYIYLKFGEPLVSSIEVRMNGVVVPQSATNGWDYMGNTFISSLNPNYKVLDLPAGTTSGFIIRFNGSYIRQNQVGASTSVNVFYNPK